MVGLMAGWVVGRMDPVEPRTVQDRTTAHSVG